MLRELKRAIEKEIKETRSMLQQMESINKETEIIKRNQTSSWPKKYNNWKKKYIREFQKHSWASSKHVHTSVKIIKEKKKETKDKEKWTQPKGPVRYHNVRWCMHYENTSKKQDGERARKHTWKNNYQKCAQIWWKTGTEEPGRLQLMKLQRAGHNWATEQSTYMNLKSLSLITESDIYSNTSTPKHTIIEQLKDKVRKLQATREVSCPC